MKQVSVPFYGANSLGGAADSPILDLNMNCPRVGTESINWSEDQCVLRIQLQADCTINCPHVERIAEKHHLKLIEPETLEDVEDEVDEDTESSLSPGEIRKRIGRHERIWGRKTKWKRNRAIAYEFLSSVVSDDIVERYETSKILCTYITKRMCFAVNRDLFNKLFMNPIAGGYRFNITKARKHREGFVNCIPKRYPEVEL